MNRVEYSPEGMKHLVTCLYNLLNFYIKEKGIIGAIQIDGWESHLVLKFTNADDKTSEATIDYDSLYKAHLDNKVVECGVKVLEELIGKSLMVKE